MMDPGSIFALCFVAITLVLAISKGQMLKGLASASIGLLLSTVGFSPIDAEPRFVFGNMHLMGGLSMTVVLLGIFALSMMIVEFGKGFKPVPKVDTKSIKGFGITFREIRGQTVNIIRSFLIGLWIGFLPGMGPGLSNLVAYSAAKASSKEPETFGQGNPAGVWAPEVANNAAIGGALIPMTALGIPGDSTTALLIGALTIHGLEMGPMVFRNSGHIVYLMFATVAICALVALLMQAVGMRVFPHVLRIPYHYMYSALIVIALISAYVESASIYKCGMMLLFGGIGIIMGYCGLPTSPLILSFILGHPGTEHAESFPVYRNGGYLLYKADFGDLYGTGIGSIFSPILRKLWSAIKSETGKYSLIKFIFFRKAVSGGFSGRQPTFGLD